MEKSIDEDVYKKTFKLYKNWNSKSNLPLIDLANEKFLNDTFQTIKYDSNCIPSIPDCETKDHFKPFDEWGIYKLNRGIDGLLIISGILKEEFRSDWFDYFHKKLPREHLNLKANVALASETFDNLRWITFGYHHDWNKKVYDFNQHDITIPNRVKDLCLIASTFLNESFKPEAGIVNYYPKNSSLCFHTDHSEINHQAPLFSLSLGSSAIFLIGGQTKDSEIPIVPILLRDSDLMIMSRESRLALHSVPKILSFEDSKRKKLKNKEILRINVNIRQVF